MVWNEKMAFLPTADYLFQHHHHHHVNEDHHHPSPPTPILTSSVPPQDFQGINPSLSMINQHRSSPIMSLSGYDEHDHNYNNYGNEDTMGAMDGLGHHVHGHGHPPVGDHDDMSDDGSQVLGEKKKRLNIEQVKTLEKNFELGNKLEPERKTQLAKALGLQPRQVAIWFQNRRARWKTKQLEKDFNQLRRRFESLQADNDSLQSQNRKLHAEALKNNETPELLGTINLNAESKGYWSNNGSDISSDINLGISTATTTPPTDSPLSSTNLGFASSSSFMPASLTAGLLHIPSKQEHGGHSNYDQTTVQEDGFCNIFGPTGAGVAVGQEVKTPAFWPWPEQQNLH